MTSLARYLLAYLWIFAGATIIVLLMIFAPAVDTEKKAALGTSSNCSPFPNPFCPQGTINPQGTMKKVDQVQLDSILSNHERWAKLGLEQQNNHQDWWANLSNYDLRGMNHLDHRDLRYANLSGAIIGKADLTRTNLGQADLICTDLSHAELQSTGLNGAHLEFAMLCDADVRDTDLQGASLVGANLSDAALEGAKMDGAELSYVDFLRTHFEIDPNSLPKAAGLAYARDLMQLNFDGSPAPLAELRDKLKALGLREQEREATAAIMRAEMLRQDREPDKSPDSAARHAHGPARLAHGNVERIFNLIFFDWTCQYGNKPGRALELLGIFFFLFAVLYVVAQQRPGRRGGIWAVWDEKRIIRSDGSDGTTRLTDGFPRSALSDSRAGRVSRTLGLNIFGLALWFSLLSTFQIGWEAFNFGTWFSQMQPREYYLRATGWVRVAAGLQSVISVYFVALWILTYFGTPFE
jgi:hypothetical protein